MNNPKIKLKHSVIYSSIKQNGILRDKFNKGISKHIQSIYVSAPRLSPVAAQGGLLLWSVVPEYVGSVTELWGC